MIQQQYQHSDIYIQVDYKIPLNSGTFLSSVLYQPSGVSEPLPVILAPTIYAVDIYHSRGCVFSRSGYVFLIVEVAGRGGSEGTFRLWSHDGGEGYEVVEWISKQPWCNGKVALWGGSNNGFYLWATLKEHPAHLETMISVSSVCPGIDFPTLKNIFYTYCVNWLALISGRGTYVNLFSDAQFWDNLVLDYLYQGTSFNDLLHALYVEAASIPQKWLSDPCNTDLRSLLPEPEDYQQITFPILTITGQYDGDQLGALHYYTMHMTHGNLHARQNHYLIIGPWDHNGTRTPTTLMGGLEVGTASLIDMDVLHQEWYDWILKGQKRPFFLQDRVAYYVTGVEEWRYVSALEAIPSTNLQLYLHVTPETTHSHTVVHAGSLKTEIPFPSLNATYIYDPLNVSMAELGTLAVESWITDHKYVEHLNGRGVIYHTEPYSTEIDVVGFVRLFAWISIDVPDTDFQATIYEILDDGTSILLTQDLMRARYRESLDTATLISSHEPLLYEFTSFRFVARRISVGSRLRLVICPPDPLYWQRNYNSGRDVGYETAQDARTATISLYHGQPYASYLELPIVMVKASE